MDKSKLVSWLQVSANIGIVLGLVLVGVQIKRSSDLTKIELLYEESRRFVELETMVVGENAAEVWAKSLEEPENLTLAEVRSDQPQSREGLLIGASSICRDNYASAPVWAAVAESREHIKLHVPGFAKKMRRIKRNLGKRITALQ